MSRPKRTLTVGSMQQADSLVDLSYDMQGTFWDVGNFKPVLKRISNGARLCDEFVKMISERASIEKHYAKSLVGWAEKWEERVPKVHEFGTLRQGWQAALRDARDLSELHMQIKQRLLDDLKNMVEEWKKDHYKKSIIHYKTYKRASSAFEKAQQPWSKRKAKIEKHRNNLDKLKVQAEAVRHSMTNGVGETKKSEQQLTKIESDRLKTEQKLKQRILEMRQYMDIYKREMMLEFNRCQAEERERIVFFQKALLEYYRMTSIGKEHDQVHQQLEGQLKEINPDFDLDTFAKEYGAHMPMLVPDDNGHFHLEGEAPTRAPPPSSTSQSASGPAPSASVSEDVPPPPPPPDIALSESSDDELDHQTRSSMGGLVPGTRVRAVYDYEAQHDDELSFDFDDIIEVLETPEERRADGWLRGRHVESGREGILPGNYVEAD